MGRLGTWITGICLYCLAGPLWAADAVPAAPLPEALRTQLAEAERLVSSGNFVAAEAALSAAAAQGHTGAQEQDAIDRGYAQMDFHRGRYDTALARYSAILKRASERRDLRGVAQAELDIATVTRRQGDLSAALGGFERALSLYRQLDDKDGTASVLTHIGLIRLNQGEYSTALDNLIESRRLQEEGAQAEMDRTFHYLGLLYAGLREYETSRKLLEQGLAEARRHSDASREAPLLGSMARVANLRGAHGEALGVAMDALRLADRLDSPPGRAYALLEIGRAQVGLESFDEARKSLERGVAIAEEIRQSATLADFRALLAEVARRQGRIDDALALWELALPSYTQGDDQPQLLTVYRSMVPILRSRGEMDRALDLALKSLQVQEQLSGLDMNRRLAVLEWQHRSEEAERQIELLRLDNEIGELKLREERAGQWRAWVINLSLTIVALLLAWRYWEGRRFSRQLAASRDELLASREALAVAHAELEKRALLMTRAASTDPLTGVSNRREFTEQFRKLFEEARTQRRELCVLIVDVDHFKHINDSMGHAAGDEVLRGIAQTLQAAIRADTLLARWGGEEFALLLPDTSVDTVLRLCERLHAAVRSYRFPGLAPVSISIGVSSLGGRELSRAEELFQEADRALFEAKAKGRDRTEVASGAREPGPAT